MENRWVWKIFRIIPININTVAILEKIQARGMNNFFITIGFRFITKVKTIFREMNEQDQILIMKLKLRLLIGIAL
jgi:hypothetical protein